MLIPSAVYEELTVCKCDLPPVIDLAAAPNRVQELREDLDPGEAEAIVLAIERRAATAAGLTVTGLPDVVAGAKKAGLIDLAKPVLDDLIQIAKAGYVLDSGGYGLARLSHI